MDLLEEGQEIVLNLRHLQLRPHPCYRDGNHVEPVNLYHKVGHGKLDMYIISPAKDNRDVKEFLSKWNANDPRLFVGRKDGSSLKDFQFPLQNLVSICALLVWQPANPNDTITRILFPGSTPQHKIFEGLDKLKHLEFLKHPVCTARSISPSASTVGITSRASSKQRSGPAVIDKLLPGEGVKAASIGSTTETNKHIIKAATIPVAGHLPDVKQIKPATTTAPISAPVPPPSKALPQTKQKVDKLTSKTEPPKMKTELSKPAEVEKISAKTEKPIKTNVTETTKSKVEPKPKAESRTSISKSKIDSKPPRSAERKSHKPSIDKKSESAKSSPTTPKKSVEGKINGAASKAETAKITRMSSRSRPSPTTTPAKSTKEANNRKVVESKYQHVSRTSSTPRGSTTKMTKKEQQETPVSMKTERKPISRRPKPGSPSKVATSGKTPGSPAKSSSAKSTPTPSVKSDKDGVIRKVRGETDRITTDSSAVSTPSTVEPEAATLKVKAAEILESTASSEPQALSTEHEEGVATDKEIETGIVEPDQEDSEAICKRIQMTADETVADKVQEKTPITEVELEEEILHLEEEREEEEDEETEDKESEVATEEIQQVKQAILEKDDIEATEEEDEEQQHVEIGKSLADELEFEVKEHKELKEEEEEEDEYLIIEKEEVEQYMEDSLQEQESGESHVPEELEAQERGDEEEEDEGELHKHLRDEVESEKEKKHEFEKDIVKVNGFHEESKDITEKEITEDIKGDKDIPLLKEAEEERDKRPDDKSTGKAVLEKEEESKVTEELNKHEEAETKETGLEKVPSKEQDEVAISKEISMVTKEKVQGEVQEIISSAEEIVTKTKQESETKLHDDGEVSMLEKQKDLEEQVHTGEKKDSEETDETKEASSISPEEKLDISSEKNREITDDTRDTDQKPDEQEGGEIKAADQRYPAEESQPDERFSTTVESAATTAPTLPEDERIPLDEIKEIVEEKYVKEETKEEKPAATTIAPQRLEQPTTLPQVVVAAGVGMFDPMAPHANVHLQRDIVKTPDEVADLPVHEEVDPGMYDSDEFSRDYKGKDDIAKKPTSQQELKDSGPQSPEHDIKEKLELKYDDKQDEKKIPFEDSEFVEQEKAPLPIVAKEEPKVITETESKKTEKAEELEAPDIEFTDNKEKVEIIEKHIEFPEKLKDGKETEVHLVEKQDVKIEDKLPAATEIDESKKTEVDKVVPEQLSEEVVKSDTEEGIVEGSLQKATGVSTLITKDGLEDKVKQLILDESRETTDLLPETKLEMVCHEEDKKEVQSVSEFKSTAEVSRDEGQIFDHKDKIKHITEEFIEQESHALKVESLPTDKQDENLGVCETTVAESDKLELEATAVEKTDLEKLVPEKSKEEGRAFEELAVKTSEAETSELKYTELKKTGKEQEGSEFEAIKTEQTKYSEEKDEPEKVFPDALQAERADPTKQLLPEVTSEESAIQAEPGHEKTDVSEVQFEDEKLKNEEKYSEKLDTEKFVQEEPISGKREELITKPEEVLKADSVTESSEHFETEKHDVSKESEIHIKSSEQKQITEPLKMDIVESVEVNLGGDAQTEIKETMAVKEIILTKEATTALEEKDVDEEDKTSKDFSLKSDAIEEVQTDISKLDMEAPKCADADHPVTEFPSLTAEEELQDKPSPSALSMTYLEIIDKLQKDSQKTSDPTIDLAEETLTLTEGGKNASEVKPKDDDDKTDEKPKADIKEHVIETSSCMTDDTKHIDSIQITDEVKHEKAVGKLEEDVLKTEKLGSDEAVGREPFITTSHLQDTKVDTEFVPGISKEEDAETINESANDKSSDKEVTEKRSDEVSGVSELRESTPTGHLLQPTDKDSKNFIKDDKQKVERDESVEDVDKIDQAELKLTDDKDDSYGYRSISPGEVFVDSGLEEEPVYGKLEAPEIPEYVTVTPDSAPPSPKLQDKKSLLRTQEGVLEKESLSSVTVAPEKSERVDYKESTQKTESVTLDEDFTPAKHESPTEDVLASGKYDTDTKEKTLDLVADVSKAEAQAITATADIPIHIPVTTAVSESEKGIAIIASSDQADEELSTSISKKQETGEASVLEDLVSASKSAIAEIEGKLSTQVEEILTAPRKEKDGTKFHIEEGKSEIPSYITDKSSSSDDKDLTGPYQLSEGEITKPSEGIKEKDEVESLPVHLKEVDETITKIQEEVKDEAISFLISEGASEKEKAHESPEKKPLQTEDKLLTEICGRDVTPIPHIAETSTSVTKETRLDHDTETSTTLEETASLPLSFIPATVILEEVPRSVTYETDISEEVKKEVTDSRGMEQSAVTITKETTADTSESTSLSSSDPACMAASSITEITSAEAIAEKETTAIITSTIATVSATQKEEEVTDSGDLTNSVTVRRMVVTASSEDGGTETELCTNGSFTFTAATVPATSSGESVPSVYKEEHPGQSSSSSSSIQCTEVASTDTTGKSSTHEIKDDTNEGIMEGISKEDTLETFTTVSTVGPPADTVKIDDHKLDDSPGDRGGSSKLVTLKTKELREVHGETESDDEENVEEFITQKIGKNGNIITEAVKTIRTFVTVEGEESDDSNFEDEDNIESTAAEDGSDSSRISKITTSLTTVTKRDDNGVMSLSTDSSDKIGDVDSEVVTKTTSTTITTVTSILSGDEADDIMTRTILEEGTIETSITHDISKDVDVFSKKEDISQPSSTDSSKLVELSKESSPLKVATTSVDHRIPVKTDTVMKDEISVCSITNGAMKEEQLTEAIGSKEDEEKMMNGRESDKESRTVGKSVMSNLDEFSSVSGMHVSMKKEAPSSSSEQMRSATPGSDAMSDRDLDIGCGPSTPHSDISSGQVSRAATNVWGSSEGRPDSRHCDSDEDNDEDDPGSPLSVTSQLAHSPPSNFYFEMGDRNASDYDVKHKEEASSSMTSSLYGSLPPHPLQELIKEGKERQSHMPPPVTSETPAKHSAATSSEDSVMTSSFYGSLEDREGAKPTIPEQFGEQLQEEEVLDFERAKHEHRAARGKDLASTGFSYNSESTSSPSKITKTYEHYYMSEVNGQKQKSENSSQGLAADYGYENVPTGKQHEDLMNQKRDIKEEKHNGKTGPGTVDPSDSGLHQDVYTKVTEHISADILKEKNGTSASASGFGTEHDPEFCHQFPAPTTSASCFPEPPLGFSQSSLGQTDNKKDPIEDWGKPLGLPAPAPPPTNNSTTVGEVLPNTNKGTPKKEKKVMQIKKTMIMNENNKAASGKDVKSKRPESPIKQPSSERKGSSNREGGRNTVGGKASGSPIYIDLTYVPHHGNSYYTTLEFFKKVRARYYVFSGTEPSREVYNALLDAKQTWEDKELGNGCHWLLLLVLLLFLLLLLLLLTQHRSLQNYNIK